MFSRSDLRREVLEASIVKHKDDSRKKVKTWCECAICKKPEAKSNMEIDHKDPVVPFHLTFDDLSWYDFIDRLWCDSSNLQAVCESCHDIKTSSERKIRNQYKKERKINELKKRKRHS